jgi:molecular chaperone Hsp33
MNDQSPRLGEFDYAGDDHVVPFQVEALDARGRAVQLGPMLDKIMARHDYPEPVARLLAEAITLTVLIGTSLKFDGKFMVQTQGDGPVDLLVADFTTPDAVRAYARFDEQALAEAVAANRLEPHELLGKGILAFTIDQGEFMQRYQGIVELDGATLEEIAGAYFRQSEQIPTKVRLSVAQLYDRDEDGRPRHQCGDAPDDFEPMGVEDDDAWVEAVAMVESIDADELTDPLVGSERLLFRLFHERGVRVFEPAPVLDRCTCSREKIKTVLDNFTSDEIAESTEDGVIAVTCEFCSTEYRFEPEELGANSAESESHLH